MSATRILIVDDAKASAESLAMFLQLEGHEVEVATNGAAGIRAAGDFRPALVLMDLTMPDIDGFEASRTIREQLGDDAPRVVAVTGFSNVEDDPRFEAAGFADVLVKPVSPDRLRELLGDC